MSCMLTQPEFGLARRWRAMRPRPCSTGRWSRARRRWCAGSCGACRTTTTPPTARLPRRAVGAPCRASCIAKCSTAKHRPFALHIRQAHRTGSVPMGLHKSSVRHASVTLSAIAHMRSHRAQVLERIRPSAPHTGAPARLPIRCFRLRSVIALAYKRFEAAASAAELRELPRGAMEADLEHGGFAVFQCPLKVRAWLCAAVLQREVLNELITSR